MTDFDESFDFVVVGSGGGSMCAALVMREAGKSVAILEKSPLVGGTTAKSGGVMWIPNNPFMARDGIEDSREKAITYLEHTAGTSEDAPGTSPERRTTYVDKAPEMLGFLMRKGIPFDRVSHWPDYYDELPGGSKEGRTVVAEIFNTAELGHWKERLRPGFLSIPASLEEGLVLPYVKRSWEAKKVMARVILRTLGAKLTGKSYVSAGAALQGRMLKAALDAGADIRPETPVRELLIADGRVVGVETEREGKPWRIRAERGVLVNAGGFSRNQQMRDRYQKGTRVEWTNTAEGDTGEMIEEMQRLGAWIAQMEEMVGYQSTIPPGAEEADVKPPAQGLTAKPHAILVDQTGVRYLNEGGSYAQYCKNMLARDKVAPAIPSWAIFDSQYMDKYMLAGTMPGRKKPAAWKDKGYLREADSLRQLASLLDIDPDRLEATVTRFNGFVEKGVDEDFHRGERGYDRWLGDKLHAPHAALGRIERPPFFAVPVVPGDVGTYGGVVTDTKARVLTEEGEPIPGLYATGVSTASVMGRSYVGAGASIGPSFVWGYVAAQHAAGLDNQAL